MKKENFITRNKFVFTVMIWIFWPGQTGNTQSTSAQKRDTSIPAYVSSTVKTNPLNVAASKLQAEVIAPNRIAGDEKIRKTNKDIDQLKFHDKQMTNRVKYLEQKLKEADLALADRLIKDTALQIIRDTVFVYKKRKFLGFF